MLKMFNNLISLFRENGMKLIAKGKKKSPFGGRVGRTDKKIFYFLNETQ